MGSGASPGDIVSSAALPPDLLRPLLRPLLRVILSKGRDLVALLLDLPPRLGMVELESSDDEKRAWG